MFYFIYGLLYLFSLLPLGVLYILSDVCYLIIYYVIGYRKKVVFHNLAIAFPAKSEKERSKIAKSFYRNFTDTFLETIKLFSAGKEFANKHFIADYSIFDRIYEQGKKCQVHLGHNFNWELANIAFPLNVKQDYMAVYLPLENKTFDRIFRKLRSRTGAVLLPATHMRSALLPWRNSQYVLGLLADQNPPFPKNGYWVDFFGIPTPFLKGPESGSKSTAMAVVFAHFTKKKRGYYQCHFVLAEENPSALKKGELTQKYARYLEDVISANPEMWLWSHRRWKFEWKPEYGEIIKSE